MPGTSVRYRWIDCHSDSADAYASPWRSYVYSREAVLQSLIYGYLLLYVCEKTPYAAVFGDKRRLPVASVRKESGQISAASSRRRNDSPWILSHRGRPKQAADTCVHIPDAPRILLQPPEWAAPSEMSNLHRPDPESSLKHLSGFPVCP